MHITPHHSHCRWRCEHHRRQVNRGDVPRDRFDNRRLPDHPKNTSCSSRCVTKFGSFPRVSSNAAANREKIDESWGSGTQRRCPLTTQQIACFVEQLPLSTALNITAAVCDSRTRQRDHAAGKTRTNASQRRYHVGPHNLSV
ncbi:hypothetical protein TcG_01552 [Trypanosoma cruzi]|nr:hypothetical protein TcG_01552 [Trypanosoma cruzi]